MQAHFEYGCRVFSLIKLSFSLDNRVVIEILANDSAIQTSNFSRCIHCLNVDRI